MTLEPAPGRIIRRRTRRDPQPHYKQRTSHQLDVLHGTPELVVPADHLARQVWALIGEIDFSNIDARRSSLGRHGHDPRRVVAILVYASMIGVHHASKIAVAIETDAAFRLLSGGHSLPQGTLRRIRCELREFLAAAVDQTVLLADKRGLLKLDEVSTDSVRIRAHASSGAARTLARSQARLAQLLAANVEGMTDEQCAKHGEKLAKHDDAVRRCEEEGRTSLLVTNPLAGLIKMPDGGAAPGHRVTVAAAGVSERIIIGLLVDASGTDHGKVGPSLDATRAALARIGLDDAKIDVAFDAGYFSEEDARAAEERAAWANVIIATQGGGEREHFECDDFIVGDDGSVICPAGRLMRGPTKAGKGKLKYFGVGCDTCELRSRCTTAERRKLIISPALHRARQKMRSAEGKERYRKRIATIEPVFSNIESTMNFRRSATRTPAAVVAEMYLKALAHNMSRLIARRRVFYVLVVAN